SPVPPLSSSLNATRRPSASGRQFPPHLLDAHCHPSRDSAFCMHSGQAGSGMWEFRAGAINRVQHVCVPEAISKIGATSHTGIIGIGVLYFFVARSCLLLNLLAVPKQPTTAWFSRRQEFW